MNKQYKVNELLRIFKTRHFPVPIQTLAEKLSCSTRTIARYIHELQGSHYRIEYLPDRGWKLYDPMPEFELSGFNFSAEELRSMMLLLNIIESISSEILAEEFSLIRNFIEEQILKNNINISDFENKIRILTIKSRRVNEPIFSKISDSLMNRKQISIDYIDYKLNQSTRNISPQRLIHYRDNWYVDAWCHLRKEIRTFSISRIEMAAIQSELAIDIDDKQLDGHFQSTYGLFSGEIKEWAELLFDESISRDISLQEWHPKQEVEWIEGQLKLKIPYSNNAELSQDIMWYIPDVQVLSPPSLKSTIKEKLEQGIKKFNN